MACLALVWGFKDGETARKERGHNKTFENFDAKPQQERPNRHLTRLLNVRTRREVRTLVGALHSNAEKLENLRTGMNFLQEAMAGNAEKLENLTSGIELIVQSERKKQTNNEDIIQRLDSINHLFVSMFVVLADVALSTSPRIVNNRSSFFELSEMFRDGIKTTTDRDIHENKLSSVYKWYVTSVKSSFASCADICDSGRNQSGEYTITIPRTNITLDVFCDQTTDGGGWLVIQRRQDGTVDFYRNWADYQDGFGDISGEFWIGNDNLHLLTSVGQELRVDIMDFEGDTAFAKYSSFVVGPSSENYRLTISGYSGTAGDAFTYQNGMEFSTTDRDNDQSSLTDCVQLYKGCWWYKSCYGTNLNGLYVNSAKNDGIYTNWNVWKGHSGALKHIELKIRPAK